MEQANKTSDLSRRRWSRARLDGRKRLLVEQQTEVVCGLSLFAHALSIFRNAVAIYAMACVYVCD